MRGYDDDDVDDDDDDDDDNDDDNEHALGEIISISFPGSVRALKKDK